MARPPREIDYSIVEGLARIQCTEREIAVAIGFCESGFRKRKKADEELVAALQRGYETGRMSLRRSQWKAAEAGDRTMLVWLGKQYLEQSDKRDQRVDLHAQVVTGWDVDVEDADEAAEED